jgi:hypothetical protein
MKYYLIQLDASGKVIYIAQYPNEEERLEGLEILSKNDLSSSFQTFNDIY